MKKVFTIFIITIASMIMVSCSCNRAQDAQNNAVNSMEQVDTVLQVDTVTHTDTVVE